MRKLSLEEDTGFGHGHTISETWDQDLRLSTLTSDTMLSLTHSRLWKPVFNRFLRQPLEITL